MCLFSCKNTAVGCHFLLQGIFQIPTQGSSSHLLIFLHWQPDALPWETNTERWFFMDAWGFLTFCKDIDCLCSRLCFQRYPFNNQPKKIDKVPSFGAGMLNSLHKKFLFPEVGMSFHKRLFIAFSGIYLDPVG